MTAHSAFAGASSWLALPLFLIGAGQGIALPALVRLNVDHVETRWAGLASGLVNTRNTFRFTFGLVEARVYIPAGHGRNPANFPAFWATG